MSIAGIITDALIIFITALIIIVSVKRGAVKTILTLVSGIASLLAAYAFTPMLSPYLYEKFFLSKMTASISDTVASLCESGKDAAENMVYDVSKLLGNSQFASLLEKYGGDPQKTENVISGISDSTRGAVDKVAESVASPISGIISDITAFLLIFVAALIVFKLITVVIGTVFKIPVLKTIDKTAGLIVGIAAALFFVLVFAMLVSTASEILTKTAPSSFPDDVAEHSLILRVLSKYNIITKITEALGFLKIK